MSGRLMAAILSTVSFWLAATAAICCSSWPRELQPSTPWVAPPGRGQAGYRMVYPMAQITQA